MRNLFLAVCSLFVLTACDPCTGCGPVMYEPTVELVFVDVDVALNGANEVVKTETTVSEVVIFWDDLAVEIPFEDGETRFVTPLRNQANTSGYSIDLSGQSFTLDLSYELYNELDVDHRMLIRASFIEATSHTFDSLYFDCLTADCLDKQTTITCYF